jgi:hypothetical protein
LVAVAVAVHLNPRLDSGARKQLAAGDAERSGADAAKRRHKSAKLLLGMIFAAP